MKQILYNIHTQTNAEVLHINGAVQYKKQQYLRLPTYTQNKTDSKVNSYTVERNAKRFRFG